MTLSGFEDAQTTQASPRAAGQAARRLAILEAAKQVFFDEGYQLASMDRIAERAGATKRTVYAYFPNKAELFGAVVTKACASVVDQLPNADQLPDDPRAGLLAFARASTTLMASATCTKLERLILAEAERHPHIAATLAAALDAGEAKLVAYLERQIAADRLQPHDAALGARLFSNAIGQPPDLRSLLTLTPAPDEQARTERTIEAAVSLYLQAYAT
jgi:TetR/AcrR family transcriptional regulator, mexJK operon transcriptional repressor